MKRGRGRARAGAATAWLPPHVELRPGKGYVYRRRSTGEYQRLAAADAPRSEVWAAYEARAQVRATVLADLVDRYLASAAFLSCSPSTQRNYLSSLTVLRQVMGQVLPDEITAPVLQLYMDARAATPAAANRDRMVLGRVLAWGLARGYVTAPDPTRAVRPFKLAPGGGYIEPELYQAFYNFLLDSGQPMVAAAMEISYLCAARQQDVIRLLRARPGRPAVDDCWVEEEGLHIYQAKTGKVQLKLWTPRLRAAVDLANAQRTPVEALTLIRNTQGQPYSGNSFRQAWQRAKGEALAADAISRGFRFHDLKITGISDYEQGDKMVFSGHKSRQMAERYNRSADRVVALDRPKMDR